MARGTVQMVTQSLTGGVFRHKKLGAPVRVRPVGPWQEVVKLGLLRKPELGQRHRKLLKGIVEFGAVRGVGVVRVASRGAGL